MTVKEVRRLWQLAKVPTHSPESLKELQELVRVAIIRSIVNVGYPDDSLCDYCAKKNGCGQAYPTFQYCELHKNFEPGDEDGSTNLVV